MFLLIGFEYWSPVYMKDNLEGATSDFVFGGFTICMTVATALGALTAGIIGDIAGGYKDRRALFCTLVVFVIQMASATVCISFSNKYVFFAGFFVMIFTENLVEPIF
jgi:MFS family permease